MKKQVPVSYLQILNLNSQDYPHFFSAIFTPSAPSSVIQVKKPEDIATELKLSLVFVSSLTDFKSALHHQAAIIITTNDIAKSTEASSLINSCNSVVIACKNIQLAMGLVLPLFSSYHQTRSASMEKSLIHPSAQIDSSAVIGAFVTIEEDVIIEAGCVIQSQSFIGAGSRLGKKTYLHPQVFVGHQTIIGSHCIIHSGSRLGTDGFGYAPTRSGPMKIPQIGNVVIGDYVEIGGNCSIDRATIQSTVIGDHTKIDNLVHIAHNCIIGKNCLITAGFMMAGSSQIGDNFMCGGGVVVADHTNICSDVTLGGRSVVTKDITTPGAYAGYPLLPLKEALKVTSTLASLVEIRKDVAQLKKTTAKS